MKMNSDIRSTVYGIYIDTMQCSQNDFHAFILRKKKQLNNFFGHVNSRRCVAC